MLGDEPDESCLFWREVDWKEKMRAFVFRAREGEDSWSLVFGWISGGFICGTV